MLNGLKVILLAVPVWLCAAGDAVAQKMPERRFIRQGNRTYDRGDYAGAEMKYQRALEKDQTSFEAAFNLSDALYRQGRFDEAAALSGQLASSGFGDAVSIAKSYYNQGNALFQQRKLEEALEAYKNSLRLNPGDTEAKFNLAYTKKLLDKDKNQDQQNQQNQDNKEQQDQQNQSSDDKKQDQGKQDQQPQQGDRENKDGQSQPRDGRMSKEEAERMLQAIQGNEDDTRKKVDEKKAKSVSRSGKNW